MVTLKVLLGERVRELRKGLGWTQTELAAKAGMDYRYVGALERGEVNISSDNIEKVAVGIGVKPYQLFLFSMEDKKRGEADFSEEQIRGVLDSASTETREVLLKIVKEVARLALQK